MGVPGGQGASADITFDIHKRHKEVLRQEQRHLTEYLGQLMLPLRGLRETRSSPS